jgi:hypothetical protein
MTEHSRTVGKRTACGGLLLAVAALVAACSDGSSSTSTAASSGAVPAVNASAPVTTQPAAPASGQVSVGACPTAQAVSGTVGQDVVTSTKDAGINGSGVNCEYNTRQVVTSDPDDGQIWSLEIQVGSGASQADLTGISTLAGAEQAVTDECDDCTVTPLTSLTPGSFQVAALDTVNGNAADQMCEDWIIDGQGRPTAVDIQATALGSSSGLSQSAACTLAGDVVNLFTGGTSS